MTTYTEVRDAMQVCANGHVITDVPKADKLSMRAFCPDCGLATTTKCEKCNAEIPGRRVYQSNYGHYSINSKYFRIKTPPRHCGACGEAYPWQRLALEELNLMLEDTGQAELAKLAADLTFDTPRTARAVLMLKTWVAALPPALAEAASELVKSIATDLVKKQMGF